MRRPSGSLTLGDSRFHERLGKGEEGGFFKLLFGFGIYIYIYYGFGEEVESSGVKKGNGYPPPITNIHKPMNVGRPSS